jgi:hypothetical protein
MWKIKHYEFVTVAYGRTYIYNLKKILCKLFARVAYDKTYISNLKKFCANCLIHD